jgi:hypothetical protein
MRVIKSVGLVVLGVALGIAGSTLTPRVKAQSVTEVAPGQVVQPGQPAGTIITSENIGFQLVATPTNRGDVATGKLMIKVNGRWLPAASSTGLVLAR